MKKEVITIRAEKYYSRKNEREVEIMYPNREKR